MDVELLHAKGLKPINGRQGRVSGMRLRIGRRATLVPDPAGRVYGCVYGLSHGEIERLYREPDVAMYRPEAVLAELADRLSVPALCFNLPPSDESGPANPKYVEKLRDVGRKLGLPADYLASIR